MAKQSKKVEKSIKITRNFKRAEEVEKFYRFVFDNDLRREAKMILERVCSLSKKSFPKKIIQ